MFYFISKVYPNCLPEEWECANRQCISRGDLCDAQVECLDGSDESTEVCVGSKGIVNVTAVMGDHFILHVTIHLNTRIYSLISIILFGCLIILHLSCFECNTYIYYTIYLCHPSIIFDPVLQEGLCLILDQEGLSLIHNSLYLIYIFIYIYLSIEYTNIHIS